MVIPFHSDRYYIGLGKEVAMCEVGKRRNATVGNYVVRVWSASSVDNCLRNYVY